MKAALCRALHVQHLKKKADAQLKAGNNGSAAALYREALQEAQDVGTSRALLANCSLALMRAARPDEVRLWRRHPSGPKDFCDFAA